MRLFIWFVGLGFVVPWLTFCFLLAAIGRLLPGRNRLIDLVVVKQSETLCKILNQKGILSDVDFKFETEVVAPRHDHFTFKGYLFIMGPFISFIRKRAEFDELAQYLVSQWMKVQKHLIDHRLEVSFFKKHLAVMCVWIAKNVGLTLHHLGTFSRYSLKA